MKINRETAACEADMLTTELPRPGRQFVFYCVILFPVSGLRAGFGF